MTRAAQRSEPQADSTALRDAFLKWQCLTRQIAVRQNQGRPDEAVTPAVLLKGKTEAYDHIITVLSKTPQQSLLPELQHLVRRTLDPAQRRQKALELLSETYYQKPTSFSDILTATFPPQSPRAAVIRKADHCRLLFSGYGQSYQIECKIWALTKKIHCIRPHSGTIFCSTPDFIPTRLFWGSSRTGRSQRPNLWSEAPRGATCAYFLMLGWW